MVSLRQEREGCCKVSAVHRAPLVSVMTGAAGVRAGQCQLDISFDCTSSIFTLLALGMFCKCKPFVFSII